MDISILALVRAEQERRDAPAVVAAKKKKEKINKYVVVKWFEKIKTIPASFKLSYNSIAAISSVSPREVVIPGKGHKYDEVIEELLAKDISFDKIGQRGQLRLSLAKKMRLGLVVAKNILNGSKATRQSYTKAYFEIIVLYLSFKEAVRQNFKKSAQWIIVGDLTTYLIALSAAAKQLSHRIIYCQYSFLDFKHLPCPADKALILNNTGLRLSKIQDKQNYYWRDIIEPKELDLDSIKNGPVGILLNIHADHKSLENVYKLHKQVRLPFEVRCHPNSKLKANNLPEGIKLADSTENLDDFIKRISLGICGNTQAQAKLLISGVPVVQMQGLDLLEYDFHGYIKRDIVIGIRKPEEFSFEDIVAFYRSEKYKTGLYNLIGPVGKHRSPGVSQETLFSQTISK